MHVYSTPLPLPVHPIYAVHFPSLRRKKPHKHGQVQDSSIGFLKHVRIGLSPVARYSWQIAHYLNDGMNLPYQHGQVQDFSGAQPMLVRDILWSVSGCPIYSVPWPI